MRLTQERAAQLVQRMHERSVVVYGDVMLDEFVWGEVTRISPEAPVPVVDIRRESVHLGGSANVLANLLALGARASVIGVVGDDRAGISLRDALRETVAQRVDVGLVVDANRPTTVKTRIIAHNQTVVRADRERRTPIETQVEERIIAALSEAIKEADAFIVSDYEKGAVTPRVLGEVATSRRSGRQRSSRRIITKHYG